MKRSCLVIYETPSETSWSVPIPSRKEWGFLIFLSKIAFSELNGKNSINGLSFGISQDYWQIFSSNRLVTEDSLRPLYSFTHVGITSRQWRQGPRTNMPHGTERPKSSTEHGAAKVFHGIRDPKHGKVLYPFISLLGMGKRRLKTIFMDGLVGLVLMAVSSRRVHRTARVGLSCCKSLLGSTIRDRSRKVPKGYANSGTRTKQNKKQDACLLVQTRLHTCWMTQQWKPYPFSITKTRPHICPQLQRPKVYQRPTQYPRQ